MHGPSPNPISAALHEALWRARDGANALILAGEGAASCDALDGEGAYGRALIDAIRRHSGEVDLLCKLAGIDDEVPEGRILVHNQSAAR